MEVIFKLYSMLEDNMKLKNSLSLKGWISIIFLIIFLIPGCSKKTENDVEKSVPVKIYKVKAGKISKYIRATGSVTADEDVIVYSKVSERVEKVFVKPGEKVVKDQVLAVQKNDILKQGMEIANSALKTAGAQAKLAAQDFERMSKLFSERAISRQQFDQSETAKETSEHTFSQAKSAYEQAKEQYENSLVKAPFDGVVAAVYIDENQMINMGQPVVQVLSSSKMKAKVNLTGEDILNVKAGQKVLIKFPSIQDEEFTGRVEKVNSSVDQMSKSLEVEIAFLTNDKRIKSGMFGEFFIETQNHSNSFIVPEASLITQTEVKISKETGLQNPIKKYFLFVVEKKSAKLIEVKTGITNDGQVEIRNGLGTGDSVIIVGQNIVKEGQSVNIIE